MVTPRKTKSPLAKVPTRKLLASIKQDLRRIPLPVLSDKPKKAKG
jgi:hypothetical protein